MTVPRVGRRSGTTGRRLAFHGIAVAVAALFLVPLLLVAVGSLRPLGLPPPRGVELLPAAPSWSNYVRLLEELPFARYAVNSVLVVAIAVPLTLVTSSWAGLAMAQLGARSRARLLVLSLAMLMVPVTALWLTRYVLFSAVGLVNNLAALIVPALAGSSPLFVLLFYWTFRRIPGEIFESARLDGAGPFRVWARIAMPLARPTTSAVAVLAFLIHWSNFIDPLLYLKSQHLYTLPVGLQQLQQLDRSNWPLLLAGSMVLTIPAVAAFLLVQRYLLGGPAGTEKPPVV